MADVLAPAVDQERSSRHATARDRLRRGDLWVGLTALLAAMLSLPLGQNNFHGPEVSAMLAVGATAMLAGQRWAITVVVLTEMLLVPTIMPRALTGADPFAMITGGLAVLAIVPGVLSMRRAAAALVVLTGWQRTQQTCRRFHAGLIATAILATAVSFVS